jgi:hypothetical protein
LRRLALAGIAVAACLLAPTGSADGYTYPRLQPVSIAFFDQQHGLVAEDDWSCQKAHGCQGRILATNDAGTHWQVTYVGARGFRLFPARGTSTVFALTGNAMLQSNDRGLHWKRLTWSPSIVSFVSTTMGWKLGAQTKLAHPPALEETEDGGTTWTARRSLHGRLRDRRSAELCLGEPWLDRLRYASVDRLSGQSGLADLRRWKQVAARESHSSDRTARTQSASRQSSRLRLPDRRSVPR